MTTQGSWASSTGFVAQLAELGATVAKLQKQLATDQTLHFGFESLVYDELERFGAVYNRRIERARAEFLRLDPFANTTLHEEPELWQQ